MSQKKKKIKHTSQQQEFTRFHNEHKKLVHQFLVQIGLEEGVRAFPEQYHEQLQKRRNFPLVYPFENDDISKNVVEVSNGLLKEFLEEDKLELYPRGPLYSVAFYFTTEFWFHHFIRQLTAEEFPGLPAVLEKIKPWMDGMVTKRLKIFERVWVNLNAVAYTIAETIYDLYYFVTQIGPKNAELANNNNKKMRLMNFILHRELREETEIKYNNEARKAVRLSFALCNQGIEHISLKAEQFGIESAFGSLALPVYIQEHALQRITERLGTKYVSEAMLDIYFSIKEPKFIVIKKGHSLIEHRVLTHKLGYFKITLTEGVLLIQTFLFLTNNGTPEGDKLNQLLGMQKADKKYWEIDKLSTFLDSDLEENEELKELFIQAGCKSLFDYKKAPKPMDANRGQQLTAGIASMLSGFVHKTHETQLDEEY